MDNKHHIKLTKQMSSKERDVVKESNSLAYPTDRLGPGSLMIQQSHTNSSRVIMVNRQFTHMVSIKDPEMPLVASGYENILASFSSMLEMTKKEYRIVKKFQKNAYNYVLIGYNEKTREYHAWKRSELEEHSEGFSTRYDNEYMDSLEEGDVVPEDTFIQKSKNFDKHMNYCYGRNFNTVYMVSTKVYEDGITIMNGAEDMMNTYRSYEIQIGVNDNDILLNWYGDEDHYQGFPKIGEKTKNGILAIVRRIDNSKGAYSLKRKRLRHIERGDKRYFCNGRVIDIDIIYNKELKDIMDVSSNKLIRKLYSSQQKYYMDLYKYMSEITNGAEDGNYTYSEMFSIICEEAHKYVDSSAYFTDQNDSIYGNMQIVFHLMDEEKLFVGSKLVGRSGNKGVIASIVPPEKSWRMEDGRPIHVVVATLGIIGRLNQSQMNEHSINELSSTAIEMMKKTNNLDEKGYIVYRLMKYLNSDEAEEFKKYFHHLNEKEKAKYCRHMERVGICIIQDPIENADITDIARAYKEFPPNWQHIIFEDGGRSLHKILCAKMFFIRLKQDPFEKFSARSRGPVNPLTTLSAKSNNKKKHLEPFSDVPVRLGEIELEVLFAMTNHYAAIAQFMQESSTSWEAKLRSSTNSYLGNIMYNEDIDSDDDQTMHIGYLEDNKENMSTKSMETIEAYLNVVGTAFDADIEYAPPGEYFIE